MLLRVNTVDVSLLLSVTLKFFTALSLSKMKRPLRRLLEL